MNKDICALSWQSPQS